MSKLPLHIDNTPATYGTSVRGFHVLVVASVVDTVATSHENYRLWGSEHIFATNGAITVCRAFDATMCISY